MFPTPTSPRPRTTFAILVVMAVSSGSQLHPLTDATPKCMLPICNRPAISFPLELLEKSDFEDIIIVTTLQFEHDVKEYVENGYRTVCGGKARIRIVTTEETGSASALRDVRSKLNITNDFFLLSADVVTDIPLAYLAGVHRFRNATATALLQAPPPKPALEEEGKAPKPVNPSDPSVGVVAIDDKTGRLIYARAIAGMYSSYLASPFPTVLLFPTPPSIFHSLYPILPIPLHSLFFPSQTLTSRCSCPSARCGIIPTW